MMARIPGHFRARVAQRLGPHVDVDQLHARILKSVLTGDDELLPAIPITVRLTKPRL